MKLLLVISTKILTTVLFKISTAQALQVQTQFLLLAQWCIATISFLMSSSSSYSLIMLSWYFRNSIHDLGNSQITDIVRLKVLSFIYANPLVQIFLIQLCSSRNFLSTFCDHRTLPALGLSSIHRLKNIQFSIITPQTLSYFS